MERSAWDIMILSFQTEGMSDRMFIQYSPNKYRATGQDVTQEMEGETKETADLMA